MTGASIETTLELWASSLRDVKGRMRGLFTQERVAASANLFLDGLLGDVELGIEGQQGVVIVGDVGDELGLHHTAVGLALAHGGGVGAFGTAQLPPHVGFPAAAQAQQVLVRRAAGHYG